MEQTTTVTDTCEEDAGPSIRGEMLETAFEAQCSRTSNQLEVRYEFSYIEQYDLCFSGGKL